MCVASCQLKTKMLQGPGLSGLYHTERSHQGDVFQLLLSVTLAAAIGETY